MGGGEQRKGNRAISISTGSCTIIPLERGMKREVPEVMFGVAESIGGEQRIQQLQSLECQSCWRGHWGTGIDALEVRRGARCLGCSGHGQAGS